MDAISDQRNIEIDQQGKTVTRKLQIGQNLGLVHRQQRFHGLQLHN